MTHVSGMGRVFDAYQNLSQIARVITLTAERRSVSRPRVLELRRRETGLEDFLPDADIVVLATHEAEVPTLGIPVRLPFDDGSFDACLVTDAYEHVPVEMRQSLLAEMLRVTDGVVLLGCPTDDPIVTRFDRIVFDFIWGKYGEEFGPLAQHRDFGLEPLDEIEARFKELGADRVSALPCNFVYRWIHQILVYFDLQHQAPIPQLFEDVNRAYNEHLSAYDYREPCYRYLLVVPTDPTIDVAELDAALQGPIESPEVVAEAEGALIEAFRAADSRAGDQLRVYAAEVDASHAELDRLRAEHDRLLQVVDDLEANSRWAQQEIALLRDRLLAVTPAPPVDLTPLHDELAALRSTLDARDRDLHRALRALARATAPVEPPPVAPPAPVVAPDDAWLRNEVAVLHRYLQEAEEDVRALLASTRWRVGDRLGAALSRLKPGQTPELAATRLLRRFDELEIAARALPTAPPTTSEPTPSEDAGLTRWEHPAERRYDVVVLANVDWDTRVQRPHHLAATFAARGHRVYYVVSSRWLPVDHPTGYALRELAENLWEVVLPSPHDPDRYHQVASPDLVSGWLDAFDRMRTDLDLEHVALHVHLQSWAPLAFALRDEHGWRVTYDCMDEWAGFPGMGDALVHAEEELVRRADLVSVTAVALLEKWLPHNDHCVLVRNAVDEPEFTAAAGPSDLLLHQRHPVIGFLGALAEWVDLELVAQVAIAHPEWTFVLVGDVFVEDLAGLDELPNVQLPGLRPYQEMPLWLFSFDVAIIPFRVDRISAAVDPVKFYEYVSLGTPVVATPLPELDEHRQHLYVAEGALAFAAAIESALREPEGRRLARSSVAKTNAWSERYRVLDAATRDLWAPVSVIVVTHGRLDLTRACVDSLLANTGHPRWELIIVDNGSPDSTPAYLRHLASTHPDVVRVVLNPDNRGFAAANNQGLAIAGGDTLVLLNNDTVVPPRWLLPLCAHLEDPSVGLVGPRSNNVGNEARIDVPYTGTDLAAFAHELRVDRAGEAFDIHMLAMFCVAMRRDVFEAVGPLDEGYGVGLFEDDDYAARVRAAGLRVVCAQDAYVHHVGQGTFGALIESGEYDELWATNKARFEARWGPWTAQPGGTDPGS
jgi:GT2 family glycosyltransferase/glycosyltransferase involved in cell wall biosynthesis